MYEEDSEIVFSFKRARIMFSYLCTTSAQGKISLHLIAYSIS